MRTVNEITESPRIITTHLPLSFLPDSCIKNKNKFIYVLRNPKDTCVSLYHFMKMVARDNQNLDFNQISELFYQGNGKYIFYA
jgi:hypothetical protein